METIVVIAPEGQKCAKERSRDSIDSVSPDIVPNNSYYRRLIAEGSLLIYNKPADKQVKKSDKQSVRGGDK